MDEHSSRANALHRQWLRTFAVLLGFAVSVGCTGGGSDPAPNPAPQAHAEERTPPEATANSDATVTPEVTTVATKITFGVYQTDKPTEIYKQFKPVTIHLAKAIAATTGESVNVELKILRTYDDGLDAIVNGDVDFMRLGPASYILAKARNSDVHLLAMESKKGKKRSSGVFVVRSNSAFQKLEDLKGASFAFGDENSTIGRFLAQDHLVQAGIYAKDLSHFEFLGRHDKVGRAVEVGDFDAGSLKIGTLKKINTAGKLRVIKEFDNVTKPWVASSHLSAPLTEALRSALLELNDEAVLTTLKVSGFLPSSDEEYGFVREGMKRAEAFNK